MSHSVAAIESTAVRPQISLGIASCTMMSILMLLLSLFFGAGQARAQCGSLSTLSTTWQNGGNSFWNIDGNWTSGTPTPSTNACILNGTSTVTLNTTGNANALQLAFGNSLSITGAGNLTLVGASLDSGGIVNGGTFTNNGTVNGNPSDPPAGGISNTGLLVNTGTINTAGLLNNGIMNNSGHVGNEMTPAQGTEIANNGTLNNTGVVFVNELHALTNDGTINNNNQVFVAPNAARLINVGTFNNNSMLILTDASSDLFNSGILNNTGTVSNPGLFVNSGTLNNSGTFTSFSASFGGNFRNSGLLNDAGTFNTGTFVNSGAVVISSAGLLTMTTNDNNYIQTAGATFVNGTLTAPAGAIVDIQGGILGGTGTINGDVLMNGVMSPGSSGTPGTLTINGNYEQGATGLFEELISGANSNGVLDVSGVLSLDPGSLLEITLQGGCDPLGDSFTILSFGSLLGEFSNAPIFFADGFEWTVTYGADDAVLTAVGVAEPSTMPLIAMGFLALIGFASKKTAEL